MIIICEECGKKYSIDPSKIKGKEIKTQCKACSHLIVVEKPEPALEKKPQDDEKTDMSQPEPESAHEPEPKPEPEPESPVITTPPEPLKPGKPAKKRLRSEYPRAKKFRFGLTAKLFFMMIVVSLVPLAMFWGITLKQTIERMRNDTVRTINQISIGMAKQLDEWLDKNVRVQKTFANMDDMISMDQFLQEPLLETIRQVYPAIYKSYSISLNGTSVARNDGASRGNYSNSPYYKDIIGGKAVAWHVLLDESTKQPALILAVPIKNGNKTVGLLVSAMRIDELSRRIVTWDEETGLAFLVDKKGRVIAHKNEAYVRKQKNFNKHPLVRAFRGGQRGVVSFINDKGKSSLGYVRDTAFGWILAIQQEEKEAFYIIDQLMSYAYLLLGVTVVFVFIMAWFSGRALSRPITRLTDTADRISVGELDVEIDTQRKDEIGDLAEAISRLQDSIRLSIEKLRKR
ncbi:cache domain-containing protein [Thermodesulfobacteriota bacterium]